jgi:hypothetical protein
MNGFGFEIYSPMVSLEETRKGGGNMKDITPYRDYEAMGTLWPEVYEYRVEDWTDTYSKGGRDLEACCCSPEPRYEKILWPIDRSESEHKSPSFERVFVI